MFLTREAFLAAEDLKVRDVEVPELGEGVKVRVKALSAGKAIKFNKEAESDTELQAITRMVAYSVVDEQGEPLFKVPEDLPKLEEKSVAALARIAKAARQLLTLDKDEVEKEAKNLSETDGEDSPSDSV